MQPIDEGAEVALKTVDRKADSMKRILFVLKDDDIYDAWVKKADQLQFISLDDSGSVPTSPSKQPTTNERKTTEKSNENDKPNVSEQLPEKKVIDRSVESARKKSPQTLSSEPNETSDQQETTEKEGVSVRDKDDKTEKIKRYVISTAELIVFVIYFLETFMNEKCQRSSNISAYFSFIMFSKKIL